MIAAFVDVGGRKIDKAEDIKELYMDPQNQLPFFGSKIVTFKGNQKKGISF